MDLSILKWNIKRTGTTLAKIASINTIHFTKKKTCFLAHDSKFNNKFYEILTFMINSILIQNLKYPKKSIYLDLQWFFFNSKEIKFIFNPNGLDTIIFLDNVQIVVKNLIVILIDLIFIYHIILVSK